METDAFLIKRCCELSSQRCVADWEIYNYDCCSSQVHCELLLVTSFFYIRIGSRFFALQWQHKKRIVMAPKCDHARYIIYCNCEIVYLRNLFFINLMLLYLIKPVLLLVPFNNFLLTFIYLQYVLILFIFY